ncbi:MAG: tripartite tricarboxylate transporter substrate binding protein [bacterium]|jgi:tripartite-type tricarboxylate transporter receptor subunit TctC
MDLRASDLRPWLVQRVCGASIVPASMAVATALAALALLGAAGPGHAADPYPSRPVRLLVPFAPGGIFDFVGRLASPKLSESIGQSVIVDNRPGGGGVIAMQTAANAIADGYTVLLADPSLVINLHLQQDPKYRLKDLAAVTIFTTASLVLAVNSKVPAKSARELADLSRTAKLAYGSAGLGSTPHMAGELFNARAKLDILHVPFKGVGPAVTAVIAGQVQLVFGSLAGTEAFIRDGRLRGLATTGEKRSPALPDLPTLVEAGFPGVVVSVWGGIFVPVATPAPIVSRLNAEFVKVLREPEVRAGLEKAAIEPLGTTSKEAAVFVEREYLKWGEVIRAAKIKAE